MGNLENDLRPGRFYHLACAACVAPGCSVTVKRREPFAASKGGNSAICIYCFLEEKLPTKIVRKHALPGILEQNVISKTTSKIQF